MFQNFQIKKKKLYSNDMLWTTVLENQNMVLMIIKTLMLKKHMKCLNKIVRCHVSAYTDFTRKWPMLIN